MRTNHATGWPAYARLGDGWPGRRLRRGRGNPVWLSIKVGLPQVLFTFFAAEHNSGRRDLDPVAFALLALGPVALAWRWRHPVLVLAVNLAATEAYYLLGYEWGPAFLSLAVAFWVTVTAGQRLPAWIAAAVGYVSYFGLAFLIGWGPPPPAAHAVALAAWLLVVLVAAEVGRARRDQIAEAVRTREEEARRRASEERLRIARELHDVVAHNISLINVQASTALHLIDERPEQARTALAAIKQASKEALGELRSVVDILRQSDEEPPPRAPAPSLARLDELVSRVRAAGLEVLVKVEGDARPLPAPVDLAAFRIVQEALTNVHRHAGASTATVHVTYGEHDLTVQVDDDGLGVPSGGVSPGGVLSGGVSSGGVLSGGASSGGVLSGGASSGSVPSGGASPGGASGGGAGIPGMRERAAALGGELEAGPRDGGGFRVLARLPLEGGR